MEVDINENVPHLLRILYSVTKIPSLYYIQCLCSHLGFFLFICMLDNPVEQWGDLF